MIIPTKIYMIFCGVQNICSVLFVHKKISFPVWNDKNKSKSYYCIDF